VTGPRDRRQVWDAHAVRWDQIYDGSGRVWGRMWDGLTRSNIPRRFERCFQWHPSLTASAVLDIGCGSGRYVAEAIARGARYVVAVDSSSRMIEMAYGFVERTSSAEAVEFRCEDIMTSQLQGRFDLVIAVGVFDYIEDPSELCRRSAAWCRGSFVASFPHRFSLRWIPRLVYWRRQGIRARFYSRGEIRSLTRGANLQVDRLERIGPVYLLRARPLEEMSP
jgi:2-polyprenyl-3-methyl-5-hydroxy-6-metoxy-1,4-benzoquinol methylase